MYRFAEFELDPTKGLTRSGRPVALEPQAQQLLELLIRHRVRIVTKEEIIDEIWSGNAITDAALNTRIRSVRKALGDTAASSEYIKTFPKRGFQFVAPLETDTPTKRHFFQGQIRLVIVATAALVIAIVVFS